MNNQFSENLKKIRKSHNLSQEQLADELGVSRQAISKWESSVAYPEMDKIIALCDKFNVNIDDLLHNDIKEVKGEEESKKKLNKYIDDFLKFITDTINLFGSMSFKSKIKCLFEQIIITLILLIISYIIVNFGGSIINSLFEFLPDKFSCFIGSIIYFILIIFCVISSIIIITHIFKTRYLDYYNKFKKDINNDSKTNIEIASKKSDINNQEEDNYQNNKVLFKKNEPKIIIRDLRPSEYRFINGLFKSVIGIIKFFALFFAIFICFILIFLISALIISFLVYKTGFFFIGLLVTILASIVITVVILLIVLNFVFNRKNDKKKMIWSFIISLIIFGMGCGMIFIGVLDFDVLDNNETILKTEIKEYEMTDELLLYFYYDTDIKYVEDDIDNVKIEYSINKFCESREYIDDNQTNISIGVSCKNPIKMAREFMRNVNNKKIITMNSAIENITVYASSENITKLKNNWKNYVDERIEHDNTINSYERRINELESTILYYEQKIEELENNNNQNE